SRVDTVTGPDAVVNSSPSRRARYWRNAGSMATLSSSSTGRTSSGPITSARSSPTTAGFTLPHVAPGAAAACSAVVARTAAPPYAIAGQGPDPVVSPAPSGRARYWRTAGSMATLSSSSTGRTSSGPITSARSSPTTAGFTLPHVAPGAAAACSAVVARTAAPPYAIAG